MRVHRKSVRTSIEFRINGSVVRGEAEPRMLLSDFIRDELGLTGTHVGCEHGVCGACTISVDGKSVRSCLMLAVQAAERDIRTVEGISSAPGELSDVQEAFRRNHALQCGFCTPGILISVEQLLVEEPEPSEQQIRDVLSGHLCRCTGYHPIVDAVLDVAQLRCDAQK